MTEEFEKWMNDWCARNPNPATVLQEQTVWAAAWQASRKQALEEAVDVCKRTRSVSAVSYETGVACADAIRALQQQ